MDAWPGRDLAVRMRGRRGQEVDSMVNSEQWGIYFNNSTEECIPYFLLEKQAHKESYNNVLLIG